MRPSVLRCDRCGHGDGTRAKHHVLVIKHRSWLCEGRTEAGAARDGVADGGDPAPVGLRASVLPPLHGACTLQVFGGSSWKKGGREGREKGGRKEGGREGERWSTWLQVF